MLGSAAALGHSPGFSNCPSRQTAETISKNEQKEGGEFPLFALSKLSKCLLQSKYNSTATPGPPPGMIKFYWLEKAASLTLPCSHPKP